MARAVKFTRSASAAQGFAGSDPGLGHGTACQATLRWHPPEPEGPTTRICNYVLGGFREKEKKRKKKEDWQQMLAQVPILKKEKKINYRLVLCKKPRKASLERLTLTQTRGFKGTGGSGEWSSQAEGTASANALRWGFKELTKGQCH